MNSIWEHCRRWVTLRHFVALFLIYLAGISSILLANRFYLDDLGRALYGYADWLPSARPLTELFSWLFYLGPMTMDASPLTQFIAIGVLALTSLILLAILRTRVSWWSVICTVPVGLSPYVLENLSYKFDSPSMALAMLCSVFPAYLARKRTFRTFSGAAALLFASASLYQPALGAYMAICCYFILADLASRKRFAVVLRRAGDFILPFVLGIGLYVPQAHLWFKKSEYTDYITQHAAIPPIPELPAAVWDNIRTYAGFFLEDWTGNSLGMLLGVSALCFTVVLFLRWLRNTCCATIRVRAATRPLDRPVLGNLLASAGRLLLLLLVLPCFWLTPLGLQVVLDYPAWSPRTFYSFGVVLSLMLLHLGLFAKGRFKRLGIRGLQALLIWQLLVFAQVYGNMQNNQKEWENSRMTLLAMDLNLYIRETGNCRVAFVGNMGRAPLNEKTELHYPLMSRLVSVPLNNACRWGYEELKTFGAAVVPHVLTINLASEPRTLFLEKPGYRIEKGPDDIGIVTFLPSLAPTSLPPVKKKQP